VLPGDVIARGIDTMVEVIDRGNLGETSSTGKTLETILALVTFLVGGVVGSRVLFAVLNRSRQVGSARYIPGLVLGAAFGLPMILISRSVNVTATAPAEVGFVWLLTSFFGWGVALTWVYDRLREPMIAPDRVISPETITVEQINRRQFLVRFGAATATLTVIGAGVGLYLDRREEQQYLARIRRNREAVMPENLPNADADLEPAPGTRPEYTPLEDHYRIDINLRPPEINGDEWRLRIGGMVDNPLTLTIDDIKNNYPAMDQYVTLACISNRVGGDLTSTTLWTGASLQEILGDAGVQSGATHLKITSEDGFYETVALDLINSEPRIMLAYHWDGIPLLYKHGFPLRIYIPDLYGMKQPKWITNIEVMDHDEDGYWIERGWDKVARMRATSVIDVVADDAPLADEAGQTLIPIGGIAHAGARGISRVEVRVDDGEWTETQLRAPLSETTWVIWRYDWPFSGGEHTFAVRCYEGDGTPQIAEENPALPSGATGIHTMTREV